MKRLALALDLDGTLLNSSRVIGPLSIKKLREAGDAGWVIILSTGRPVRTIQDVVPGWFSCFYWAACNGAWILKDNRIIKKFELSFPVAAGLMQRFREHNIHYMVEAHDRLFTDKSIPGIFFTEKYPLAQLPETDVCKILVNVRSAEEIDFIYRIIPGNCITVITDNNTLIQISSNECDKLKAVQFILEKENILQENLVAIGDDNNDLSLVKAAGYGVAMRNASHDLYAAADLVIAGNDEDGVGLFLEKLLAAGGRIPF